MMREVSFSRNVEILSSLLSALIIITVLPTSNQLTVAERIVADLEIIESPHGVQTDFKYNETFPGFGRLNSVPGCPKSIDGYPWVYYGVNPRRCYLTGYRGPCPENRLIFVQPGSPNGVCGCECFQYVSSKEVVTSPDGRWKFCNMYSDQVYDSRDRICYDLQKRGPCPRNQWLVRDQTELTVTCVPKCPKSPHGPLVYDHRTEECVFASGGAAGAGLGPIIPNVCPQGESIKFKYSQILKRCVPVSQSPGDYIIIG